MQAGIEKRGEKHEEREREKAAIGAEKKYWGRFFASFALPFIARRHIRCAIL